MAREDDLRVAAEVAERVGLLARCPKCGEVYDPLSNSLEDAYRLANSMITSGDPLVSRYASDRQQLTDAIRDVCGYYPNSCSCGASGARREISDR